MNEYEAINEEDKDLRLIEGDLSPFEILAYQLGWLGLIQEWEKREDEGEIAAMSAPEIK